MTTELAHAAPSAKPPRRGPLGRLLARPAAAQLVLYWERLAPAMLPGLAILWALAMVSLMDLWRLIPAWAHAGVLALAAAALATTVLRDLAPLRWPSRRAALQRLEEDGRLSHAPLQALADRPADPGQGENPLWRAHLAASAERARAARLSGTRDALTARDPVGLRFMAAGLLAIALIAAGDAWRTRLRAALEPGAGDAALALADVWIEPPDYTGAPPVYLLRAGERLDGLQDQVNVPAGSRAVAQVNGRGRARMVLVHDGGVDRAAFEASPGAARGELVLAGSGLLKLKLGGADIRWPVGLAPDAAPLVAFTEPPAESDQNLVAFRYVAEDDYGVAAARLEMRLDPDQDRPLDAPVFDAASLAETRSVDVAIARRARGEQAATLDLQSDPWAGLKVLARLVVVDGAGQTGATGEEALTLPTRRFFNPLARSVVEQRQALAVAPDDWRRAGRSFDAVTLAPDVFFADQPTDYLLMRAAFWRVMRQDGEGFGDAVEKFWPLALQLEDGAVELARQRLEAAQEALRAAIERGASEEEIARLTEELRQAMNNYLEALAQAGEMPGDGGEEAQQIEKSSLDEMLDKVRDLAQSGAGNAARNLLSELEDVLKNLRLGQSGGGSGEGSGQGSGQGRPGGRGEGASGQAGDLIGRQRALADDAFERGQTGEPGESADDLAAEEGALGSALDELIDALQGEGENAGADPDGAAARAMGRARDDMREAEDALRNGDFDSASSAMERAIARMREGAEGLAREEMRQAGQGRNGEGARSGGADPLGRPAGDAYGRGVDVPEESDAARSRAIIEKLRERLRQPDLDEEEMRYLERLLERF